MFLPVSSSRGQALQKSMEMKLRNKADPRAMLTGLDYLADELSELSAVVTGSMTLQYFFEGSPDKYHLEKRMLAGESLIR